MTQYNTTARRVVTRRNNQITIGANVIAPAIPATFISGAFLAVVIAKGSTGVWRGGSFVRYGVRPEDLMLVGVSWIFVYCVVFAVFMRYGGEIEEVTGIPVDLNNDGEHGVKHEPPPPHLAWPGPLEVNHYGQDGTLEQTQFMGFGIPRDKALQLFQMALDDDRVGNRIIPNNDVVKKRKLITGDEWANFMSVLRNMQWADYYNEHETNGHVLTSKGRRSMEEALSRFRGGE